MSDSDLARLVPTGVGRAPLRQIVLVACAGRKRPEPEPARDLYTASALFRKARRYAECYGAAWWILSAQYGLLASAQIVAPYDRTLKAVRAQERERWARDVFAALQSVTDPIHDALIFLAGRAYREPLMAWCERAGYAVAAPLAHLGIGQQQQWLDQQVLAATASMHRGAPLPGSPRPAKGTDGEGCDAST